MPWIIVVFASVRLSDTPGAVESYVVELSHRNSLRAVESMPSDVCGSYASNITIESAVVGVPP